MRVRTSKSGLYRRLLLYFSLISLIPLILLGSLAIITANRLAVGNVRSSLLQLTETAARILESELIKYRNSIDLFCADEQLIEFLEEASFSEESPSDDWITRINQKVYLIMAGHASSLSFYIINSGGAFVLATSSEPREFNYARYENWGIFRALNSREGAIFYPGSYTDHFGQEDTGVTVGGKVVKNSKTLGYVMLNIRSRTIGEILPPASDMRVDYALADSNYFLVFNQFMTPRSPFIPGRYRAIAPETSFREYPEERYMIAGFTLPETGLTLYGEVSTALMAKNSAFITTTVIIVMMLFVFICIFTAHQIAKRILEPIRTICDSMEIIKEGNLHERVKISTRDEFEIMAEGFNRMIEQLDTQFKTDMERQNRLRLAEIKNLQAQIAPHFLYNTLESIKWLAKLGMSSEIQTIVEKLGILLKSGMYLKKEPIPLRDEMRVVSSYIGIQQIRHEDRFTVSIDIPEELMDCLVPNLVIQPIVENAMVHGVEKKVGTGSLSIRGYLSGRDCGGQDMCIEIIDNGPGMSREKIETLFGSENTDGESIGIKNVDRRIKLDFGPSYGVSVISKEGEGAEVTVKIPFRLKDSARDLQSHEARAEAAANV